MCMVRVGHNTTWYTVLLWYYDKNNNNSNNNTNINIIINKLGNNNIDNDTDSYIDNDTHNTINSINTTKNNIRATKILGKNSDVVVWYAILPPYSWKVSNLVRCTCKLQENSIYKYKNHL